MIIAVTVKPGSKVNKVEKLDDNTFIVRITQRPIEGKANEALQQLLSDYFHVSKSSMQIVKGTKSRLKQVEISL